MTDTRGTISKKKRHTGHSNGPYAVFLLVERYVQGIPQKPPTERVGRKA